MEDDRVSFRPKSSWQKKDCINRSAEYQCPNESTIEAVVSDGKNHGAIIRCCEDAHCKDRAIEIALAVIS